jgi:outer membrane protein assembly factor BamE (lipoprotein component of BamABCDE complex)
MNEVFETATFSKLVEACDKQEQRWIEKVKDQLAENLRVGKPLRFSWFREKKFGNKRFFYLINEKSRKAVLVAFGSKKDQQKIINHIIANKEIYLTFIA